MSAIKRDSEDKPPHNIEVTLAGGEKSIGGIPTSLMNSLLGILIQRAIERMPRDQKIKLIQQLAELVWPGSTRKEPTDG